MYVSPAGKSMVNVCKNWFVYLLRCADGTFYTGITTDPARRLAEHNGIGANGTRSTCKKGARYTRARQPVTLVWSEPAADRAEAARREYVVRKLPRAEKERLAQTSITSSE